MSDASVGPYEESIEGRFGIDGHRPWTADEAGAHALEIGRRTDIDKLHINDLARSRP